MTTSTTNRRNRAKGQAYERRVRDQLAEAMPGSTWKRRVQTRGGRVDGSDVEGLDAQGKPIPLWIEAHCGQKSAGEKLDQATRDAPPGWHPIAIVHRPGTEYRNDEAMLTLGDLMELCDLSGFAHDEDYAIRIKTPLSALLSLLGRWWGRRV